MQRHDQTGETLEVANRESGNVKARTINLSALVAVGRYVDAIDVPVDTRFPGAGVLPEAQIFHLDAAIRSLLVFGIFMREQDSTT